MNLVVHIPATVEESFPDALALAQLAPTFTTEGQGDKKNVVAIFTDLPHSLDLAVDLVGATERIPGAWASINARRVVSLMRFWSALICYAESLTEADPHAHCVRVSARLTGEGGCPSDTCVSHCQFICTRCLGVERGRGTPPIGQQLREIARQAEVDWCPNLRLP